MKPSDDEGSTLPLIIFFGMLSMVLVLIVVAASSLYLERKRLFTLADSAALVGAEAFELTAVAPASGGIRPQLTSGDVRAEVADFIESTPNRFEALQIERAETIDGLSATVSLSSYWRPPVVTLFVPEGIRIEVTSVGRSVFG